MDIIQLDLQYISNPSYKEREESANEMCNKKDIKFYKKRILYTFKEMVKQPDKLDHLPLSLQTAFYDIIKEYVDHFKQLDTSDALQSFLPENEMNEKERKNKEEIMVCKKEADTFLFSDTIKQKQIKHKTMKDFCIDVTKQKKNTDPIYPKQKQFSIHSKKHKNKGIPSREKKKGKKK